MESRTCAKYVRRKGGKGCESRARARERAGESGRERAAPVRKRERDDLNGHFLILSSLFQRVETLLAIECSLERFAPPFGHFPPFGIYSMLHGATLLRFALRSHIRRSKLAALKGSSSRVRCCGTLRHK